MDMYIGFSKKVICATVYIKLVAPDLLLLSKAVCCQLGIVFYHLSVQSVQEANSADIIRPTNNSTCEGSTELVVK